MKTGEAEEKSDARQTSDPGTSPDWRGQAQSFGEGGSEAQQSRKADDMFRYSI